jgi:hypothetical protein
MDSRLLLVIFKKLAINNSKTNSYARYFWQLFNLTKIKFIKAVVIKIKVIQLKDIIKLNLTIFKTMVINIKWIINFIKIKVINIKQFIKL